MSTEDPLNRIEAALAAGLAPDLAALVQTALVVLRSRNDELTAAREALEVERQRYWKLYDFAPDAYLVTDARGVILEANQAACTLFNVTPSYLVGRPVVVLVRESDRAAFRSRMSEVGSTGRLAGWELRVWPREKEPVDTEVTVAVAPGERDLSTVLWWLLRDVTERKQAEEVRSGAPDDQPAPNVSPVEEDPSP